MLPVKYNTTREGIEICLSGARHTYKLECTFWAIRARAFFATIEKEFQVERVKNNDDGTSVVFFKTNTEQAETLVERMQDIVEATLYDL